MLKRERTKRNDSSDKISENRSRESNDKTGISFERTLTNKEEQLQPIATRQDDSRYSINKTQQMKDRMSEGRREAFEIFRRDYPHNSNIDENKQILKQRYVEAKSLGEKVNNSRKKINTLKTQIEQHRIRRSMQVSDDNNDEEERLRHTIEEEKLSYKENFNRLRLLKTEIEHLQHLLEKSKIQMQKDFEVWWREQSVQRQEKVTAAAATAWKTPTPPQSSSKYHHSRPQSSIDVRENEATLGSNDPPSSEVRDKSSGGSRRLWRNPVEATKSPREERRESLTKKRDIKDAYEEAKRSSVSNGKTSFSLTGDKRADEDIMSFIKARQSLLNNRVGK